MLNHHVKRWLKKIPHEAIHILGCITIIIGLFSSRALISIGMMGIACNALLHFQIEKNFRTFLQKPYLWLLSTYFLMMLISGSWSTNTTYLFERLQILLPFLFLPFAFHSMKCLPQKKVDAIFLFFIFMICAGICWSLWFYFKEKEIFDEGYGFSRMIPTPFKNDHIRFSLSVVLGIALAVDLIIRTMHQLVKWMIGLFILGAIIYLHILSAKSGLLVFYCLALITIIRMTFIRSTRLIGVTLLILLLSLPFIMFQFSDTFRNKIGYFRYSLSMISNASKDANVSDEGRLISYAYALDAIKQHPITGVGLGDVMDEMKLAYRKDFPQEDVNVLLPHNQFLMAGMAAGIPGVLCLSAIMFSLFSVCRTKRFISFAFVCMMVLAMMVEPLFETQYGTCMFVFFLLLLLQQGDPKR